MDVKDVRKVRDGMAVVIEKMVNDFEKMTGVKVEGIDLNRVIEAEIGGSIDYALMVSVELKL